MCRCSQIPTRGQGESAASVPHDLKFNMQGDVAWSLVVLPLTHNIVRDMSNTNSPEKEGIQVV